MVSKVNDSVELSVITGVIGVDAHVIGNWLITHVLEQAGFKVHRLGSMVSQEEFINAALETRAKAIILSSIYGMGDIDCRGFREKLEEAGLKDILLYIGGNLTSRQEAWDLIEKEYKSLGFDRIYPPDADLDKFVADLKTDLGIKN